MSYVNIWVHAVWGTKRRERVLLKEGRTILFKHILENAKKKDIELDELNGYLDHVHCIIKLGKEQSIAKVMQLIKGEAAFWTNKNKVFASKVHWADQYFARSIGEGELSVVRNYIINQNTHHKVLTYSEEYEKFMKEFGYQYLG